MGEVNSHLVKWLACAKQLLNLIVWHEAQPLGSCKYKYNLVQLSKEWGLGQLSQYRVSKLAGKLPVLPRRAKLLVVNIQP